MSEAIRHHVYGNGVHHLEIDRPQLRNALGQGEYASLAQYLAAAHASTCKAVVLSGCGPSFCAGNELAEFETAWPQPPCGPVYRFLAALAAVPAPVVAAIQGAAVGIGATMLLHCDVVIAQREAFLMYPFVKLGISVEGGSSLLLPARVGYLRAMEILLTGRRVPVEEARDIGLVTEVVESRATDRALELAGQIAALPEEAVRTTKRQVRSGAAGHLPGVFEDEIQAINTLIVGNRERRAS